MPAPEITIVTETFNLEEGQGIEATRQALFYVAHLARSRGDTEIILADPMRPNVLVASLLHAFPNVKHLPAPGAGYEAIKNLAAREARGRYVVYLDSDCRPLNNEWLDRLLAPLRSGEALSSAGTTYYYGNGIWPRVQSMLDFGFLLGNDDPVAGCYASNNCAFVREHRMEVQPPNGPMRSTCYAHAQSLIRLGKPMRRVPDAICQHKLPNFWQERWRRGFDLVAACWVDPLMPETRWLRLGVLAAPLFILANLRQDWRRLSHGQRHWGWTKGQLRIARSFAIATRMVDFWGAVWALIRGPDKRWSAYGTLQSGP